MRTKHCFVTGAMALLTFAATQAPASAASLSLDNGSAKASYNTVTEVLEVCDTAADGRRAVARLSDAGGTPAKQLKEVADTNGAGNSCARATISVGATRTITLSVWVQAGAEGAPEDQVSKRLVVG